MKPRLPWDGFVFVTQRRYKELEDRDYELSLRARMEDCANIEAWDGFAREEREGGETL